MVGECTENFCLDSDPATSTGYWDAIQGITYPYDLNDIESDRAIAVNKAKAYGTSKGGRGRLLTYDEAYNLKDKIESIVFGTYSELGDIRYYLATAQNYQNVYYLFWDASDGPQFDHAYFGFGICSVRPVIEISKDIITD